MRFEVERAAASLADHWAAVGVSEENGEVFVSCYAESLPEDGEPGEADRVYQAMDDEVLMLVWAKGGPGEAARAAYGPGGEG